MPPALHLGDLYMTIALPPRDAPALSPARLPEDDRLREECGVFGVFGHDDAGP